MKKLLQTGKLLSVILLFLLLLPLITVPAYAWACAPWFICEVEIDSLPDGARYVDLLLPISEQYEAYCAFNADNGELYDIAQDSEIVSYCRDGYQSYTFHISDASSKMALDHTGTLWSPGEFFRVEYGENSSWYLYEHAPQLRTARFAYLDETGHVLAVTNESSIYPNARVGLIKLEDYSVELSLHGETLISSFNYGTLPVLALFYQVVLFGVVCFILLIIIVVKRRNTRRAKNKNALQNMDGTSSA